ncbi:MAG: hypothetical protein ABJO67_20115 [Pseudoruegeria sp.]
MRKDDGTLATKGEQGSIEVFSKTRLFSGYSLDRTGIRADGWFNTGDRGVFAGANLRLVGREKNTIVVHGRKTTCEEIEMRLALIPRFAGIQILATAFRWPEDDTDRLAIFVEGSVFEAHDSDEALAHLKSIVARRFGLTVDTFFPLSASDTPRTTTGKIDRQNLVRNILTENFKVYELSTKNGPQTSHAWPDGLTGRIAR